MPTLMVESAERICASVAVADPVPLADSYGPTPPVLSGSLPIDQYLTGPPFCPPFALKKLTMDLPSAGMKLLSVLFPLKETSGTAPIALTAFSKLTALTPPDPDGGGEPPAP